MLGQFLFQTFNMSFVPLTGLLFWPILSRYLEHDTFSQILVTNSVAGWILAISSFGLTTRGVTCLATSDDPDNTRYQLLALHFLLATASVPLVAVLLNANAMPSGLVFLLLAYILCAPTQMDWADHGNDNFRRPFLKNATARLLSLFIVAMLLVFGQTNPVALSGALLFPQIVINISVYRAWLRTALHASKKKPARLRENVVFLFWPGLQRVATSTYANLDVILVPIFFSGASGIAVLYVYRILKATMGFFLGGTSSFLPGLARRTVGKSDEEPIPILHFFVAVLVLGVLLSAGLLAAQGLVIRGLGAEDMANVEEVYRILVLALIPMTMNNLLVNMLLYPQQKEKHVLASTVMVTVCVAAIFGFLDTIMSAAWVFVCAEFGLLALNCFMAWKKL